MGVVTKLVKKVGALAGYDSNAIEAAGREQAAATTAAANKQSAALRDQAAQAQRAQETMTAQRQAADAAAALLNTPTKQAEVDISGDSGNDNIDPVSGKRLKPRDAYSAASINI